MFHQIRRQRRETVRAAKLHRAHHFLVHVLHHLPHAIGAADAQPPQRRPAEQHGARAERQRLDDVGAAADAAVDIDFGLAPTASTISEITSAVVTVVSRCRPP